MRNYNISNKLLLYIICIICILITLYLGYIIFKQNEVEGFANGSQAPGVNVGWFNGAQCASGSEKNGYCTWPLGTAPPKTSVGWGNGAQCTTGVELGGNCVFAPGVAPPATDVGPGQGAQCTSGREIWGHCTWIPGTAPLGTFVGIMNGDQCKSLSEKDGNCNQPMWDGTWELTCTGNGVGNWTSYLNDVHTKGGNAVVLNNCMNSLDCGSIPDHNSTPPLLAPDNPGRPKAVVYADKISQCYPHWDHWENKKCAGFGVSTHSGQVYLADGVDNSPKNGQDAVNYCGDPGSSICNGGNPALNTPSYDTTKGDTITYSKPFANQHWATITIADDPYCYPTWQPWQAKQCTGYKTSKTASRLTIPSLKVPGQADKSLTDAVNFCFKPENRTRCSGPGPSVPQFNPSLNMPQIDTSNGDTTIASVQGIGEAWGEIDYGNDKTCLPTWEANKPKEKLRYGVALYGPKMNGISKDWEVDCNRLMNDISYTSIDSYTWTPDKKLCKGNTCYSASLVKQCQTTAFGAWGNFLKRDPEYANDMFGWWPFDWPGQAIDAAKYYAEGVTDKVPE